MGGYHDTVAEMSTPIFYPAVPFAYDKEFVWEVTGLAKSVVYWVRCRAFIETYYGPWCPSLPPFLLVDA